MLPLKFDTGCSSHPLLNVYSFTELLKSRLKITGKQRISYCHFYYRKTICSFVFLEHEYSVSSILLDIQSYPVLTARGGLVVSHLSAIIFVTHLRRYISLSCLNKMNPLELKFCGGSLPSPRTRSMGAIIVARVTVRLAS